MANPAKYPIRKMCKVSKVSPTGFYGWRDRVHSKRALANTVMTERIRNVHANSDATYRMPRVRAEPMDQGTTISRKRVARLMRNAQLRGVSRRRG